MGFESFIALCILSFSAAFTPGPNNALVAASGANFGFRRTFPHVLGISLGFPVMIFIVGLFWGSFSILSLAARGATVGWGRPITLCRLQNCHRWRTWIIR